MKRREFLGGAFALTAVSLILPPATLVRSATRAIDPNAVLADVTAGNGWLITGVRPWVLKDPARRPTMFQHFDNPFGLYATYSEHTREQADQMLREFVEHLAEYYVEVV